MSAVLNELGNPRDARRDDRHAGGERLHQRDRDALHLTVARNDAGQHEQIGRSQQLGDLGLRAGAQQVHAGAQPKSLDLRAQLLLELALTDQAELDTRERLAAGERVDQDAVALVLGQARDAQRAHGAGARQLA